MRLKQIRSVFLSMLCVVVFSRAQVCDRSLIKVTNTTDWKVQVDYEKTGRKHKKILQIKETVFLKNPMHITQLTVEPEGRFWSIDSVPRLVGDWIRSKNLVSEVQKTLQENSCKDVEIKIGLPAELSEDFRTFNIKIGISE